MEPLLYFLAGSVFTVLTVGIGILLGYSISGKRMERTVERRIERIRDRILPNERKAGPVKIIDPDEEDNPKEQELAAEMRRVLKDR